MVKQLNNSNNLATLTNQQIQQISNFYNSSNSANQQKMRPEQIKLVKKTWKILMGINPVIIGDAFYSKLFADHPTLRKLFPLDMNQQYVKLVDMLSSIIMNLDHPNIDSADITAMSKRHIGYGVKPEHYAMVGTALIWTLKKGLGTDWNQETEDAWTNCYKSLADVMIQNS
jgi:hemoglobin-like flavoprotein